MSTRYDLLNYLGASSQGVGHVGAAPWLRLAVAGRLGSAQRWEGLDAQASNKHRATKAERLVSAPNSAAG